MNKLISAIKSGDSPFFWVLFSVGITLGLLYSFDFVTGSNLMEMVWHRVGNFW